jgi:hypothetical protein
VLSERQRNWAVVLQHGVERSEAEALWAMLSGLGDVLALMSLRSPASTEDDVRRSEQTVVQLGRLYDMASRGVGEDGIIGPDPIANELRVAARRTRKWQDHSRPLRSAPTPLPDTEPARIANLAGAMVEGLQAVRGSELCAGDLVACAQLLRERAENVRLRFADLERTGRAADVVSAMATANASLEAMTSAMATVARPAELDLLAPSAHLFMQTLRAVLAFSTAMALADDADDANDAVDHLLAALAANRA